jgi:hypothetical protein
MKKLTLIAFALFLFNAVNAQTFNKVIKATAYKYQNDEWVEIESSSPERMFIIIEGYNIKITNQEQASIITYGDADTKKTSEYQSSTWDAYDKDGKQCLFTIKKYYAYERFIISIMYSKYLIEYIVEKN